MHRLHVRLASFVLALLSTACASRAPADAEESAPSAQTHAAEPPQKGSLRHWPEATSYLLVNLDAQPATIELGLPRTTGMDAFWSVASTKDGGSAFFYSSQVHGSSETRVAYPDVARVQEIHDASRFDYGAASVGPVPAGRIVLVHHVPSGRYLAIVVDAITPSSTPSSGLGPYAYADITWYLSAARGGGDFSSAL